MGIAKHYETAESLPEDVYLKLLAARTFRAGSLSLRQVSIPTFCPFHLPDHLNVHLIVLPFNLDMTLPITCDILLFQLRFASVDLQLHTKYIPGGAETIYDVDQRVCERTQVLPPLPEDRFLCSFSHIFAGLSSHQVAHDHC